MIHSRLFYHLLYDLSRKVQLFSRIVLTETYNSNFGADNFRNVHNKLFILCPLFLVSFRLMYRNK